MLCYEGLGDEETAEQRVGSGLYIGIDQHMMEKMYTVYTKDRSNKDAAVKVMDANT